MSKKIIEVVNLKKIFGKIEVLKGINLHVYEGEIFALLGANGSGKTTTVKILSTLLKKDCGNVNICGYNLDSNINNIKSLISLTGQFTAVDDVLSGRENLLLVARLRHVKNPKLITEDLLKRFGLTDAANRRVSTYSGGMRRRIDIAMSLIGTPKIIFLDEPTTGLDPEARIELWKIVNELKKNGITIFLTTQYLEEAEQLADTIAILNDGKIIASGSVLELRKLIPPVKKEYVEKQPTLEEIFLAVINERKVEKND
ncbi:MAG: ABC transporter ATP-binding protein [Anaeroplasmataceae bacterium]